MSSKSYLVSSPTSHKSISSGSLLLSGCLPPDHVGPCPLPHRLAARAARGAWPPVTRPCPPHAALRPAQQLPCPRRPAAPARVSEKNGRDREDTVERMGNWGRYDWIRGIIVLWSYYEGFCCFLIFCIPETTNRVKSRDKLSLSSYKAGVKSQR